MSCLIESGPVSPEPGPIRRFGLRNCQRWGADGGYRGARPAGHHPSLEQAAWSLAALALTAQGDGPPELTAAAKELLAAAGLTTAPGTPLPGLGTATPGQIASRAAAALHEASALAGGRGHEWCAQSDEVLLAQGRASAQRAVAVARFMLPMMGDLSGRLAAPGARLLDVGTGAGALAVAFAQVFPQVHVLGIDILDRALGLARQAIAASDAGARVTVRTGLRRIVAALRPGGWLIVGHGKLGGTPTEDALTRLKTLAYGGTLFDDAAACPLLHKAGLTSVRTVPTPAGAAAITIGQNPA